MGSIEVGTFLMPMAFPATPPISLTLMGSHVHRGCTHCPPQMRFPAVLICPPQL
ncbi:hypothetical protein [Thermococcus peptonophilus]|uniref:hypothetical protein n=1 Tax=Thermococcus peptonophilus TaxID=53952 RepID=UPI000A87DEFA